jgi:hypothetical protein
MIRRRRRGPDPRKVMLNDTIRAAGYLDSILTVARHLNAPDTVDLVTGLLFVRMFARKVELWIELEDQS